MKTLIIALLISSVVSGQNIDTAKSSFDKCHPIGSKDLNISVGMSHAKDSVTGNGMATLHRQKPALQGISIDWQMNPYRGNTKQDTIPAMLLITDTSIAKPVYQVFAIKGYHVLENGFAYNENMNPIQMKYLVFYLDSNKKPLPNTWVVWQTSIY